MAHILSYGSLNLDLVYQVPHFVQAGETLNSTSRTVHCGGKGLNQSIAAARAGGTVSHAGKIGGDGTVLTDILRESGVDTDFVTVGDGPSGHAVIQVDPSGQNCILLFGGCNQEITHEEIDRVLARFQAGDYLILQNEINGLDHLMTQAARRGLRIVFNPSPIDVSISRLPLGGGMAADLQRDRGSRSGGLRRRGGHPEHPAAEVAPVPAAADAGQPRLRI